MMHLPSQAQIDQVLATLPGGCCRKWGVVCPYCLRRNHVQVLNEGPQMCPECGTRYQIAHSRREKRGGHEPA